MKSFIHNKQWLVIDSQIKDWQRLVLAWVAQKRQLNLRYPQSGSAIRLLPIASYAIVSIILATLSTGAVSAETLSDYCLAKQDNPENWFPPDFQRIDKPLDKYWHDYKPRPLSITVQGKVFNIHAYRNELWITDEQNKETFNKVYAPQKYDASIYQLGLQNDGRLMIKGIQDYTAKLDVSKLPPVIETPIQTSSGGLPLPITAQGKVFHIHADGSQLWITDEYENKALSEAYAPQIGDPGGIGHLVLLSNDWLWIRGTQGYIAKLNVSKLPPVIETPKRISDLTYEPIYRTFSNWFDGKLKTAPGRAFGYYSPRLNRIFVTGYHLGSDEMESLEVIDGQVRRLPEPLQGAYIYNEMDDYQYLAKLNGDLFVGRQGEVFFYDGSHVTTLLDIPDEEQEKRTIWDKFSTLFTVEEHKNVLHPPFVVFTGKNRPWSHHIIPASQRIFLTGILGKQQFFAELKRTDSPLTPVFIDEEIVNFVVPDVGFYQFPDEKQLIVITKHSVLAETPKGMTTLIKVSDPSELHAALNGNQINPLNIYNGITRKFTDYQLVRASDSAHCIARLDPNKPIVLDNP
jgi:hypothetical protein